MIKSLKVILVLNAALLAWSLLGTTGRAQRPPQTNPDGTPFLPVNINPTDIPPMVNINPYGEPARVDVIRLPEIRLPEIRVVPSGCDNRENFMTAVGRSIVGPIVVTYLNVGPQAPVTLVTAQAASQRITLSNTQLATAIYLRPGQQMNFDADVMYSGCRPQ